MQANKAQDKPAPEPLEKKEEPHDSPNVLIPLVEAIEFVCSRHASVTEAIAAALSEIHFAMIPGPALVASLTLHQGVDTPVVAPSRVGVPPIKGGVLMYTGCFESGSKGCHTKQYIIDVFEEHFRCREKGYVHELMAKTVPHCNQNLSAVIGVPVEIEVGVGADTLPADPPISSVLGSAGRSFGAGPGGGGGGNDTIGMFDSCRVFACRWHGPPSSMRTSRRRSGSRSLRRSARATRSSC